MFGEGCQDGPLFPWLRSSDVEGFCMVAAEGKANGDRLIIFSHIALCLSVDGAFRKVRQVQCLSRALAGEFAFCVVTQQIQCSDCILHKRGEARMAKIRKGHLGQIKEVVRGKGEELQRSYIGMDFERRVSKKKRWTRKTLRSEFEGLGFKEQAPSCGVDLR